MSIFKFFRKASLLALGLLASSLSADISLIGDMLEQYDSAPGGNYSGSFTVRNIGQKDESVRIFVTDYTYKADGTSHFHESTPNPAHERSNATWVTLDTQKALIAPGEERVVRYSVRVPDQQPVKGTFWSVLIVEPEIEIQETDTGVSLTPIFRYAVQIMNHFRDGAKANLKVDDCKVDVQRVKHENKPDASDKEVAYVLDIENDGELGLNPEVTVELLDKDGKTVFEGKRPKSWLLPKCSVRARFDISTLPSGKYSGIVTMDAGGENYFGDQNEVTVP